MRYEWIIILLPEVPLDSIYIYGISVDKLWFALIVYYHSIVRLGLVWLSLAFSYLHMLAWINVCTYTHLYTHTWTTTYLPHHLCFLILHVSSLYCKHLFSVFFHTVVFNEPYYVQTLFAQQFLCSVKEELLSSENKGIGYVSNYQNSTSHSNPTLPHAYPITPWLICGLECHSNAVNLCE